MANKKGVDYISQTLSSLKNSTMYAIHVAEIAKVTSVADIDDNEVNVTPLGSDGDGKPELQSVFITDQAKFVPDKLVSIQDTVHGYVTATAQSSGDSKAKMMSYRKLKVGDIVAVAYLDYDHDNFQGSEFEIGTNRSHSVNDAIVIGTIGGS